MPFTIRPYRRFFVQRPATYDTGAFIKLPLIHLLSFGVLITLLVLSSAPAYAEWVKVGENDDGKTLYVDPDTIRRKGDLVKMWHLHDYKTIETYRGNSFMSNKSQWEYDCAEEQIRALAEYEYSGPMGNGELVRSDSNPRNWAPVIPGSMGQIQWTFACGKK